MFEATTTMCMNQDTSYLRSLQRLKNRREKHQQHFLSFYSPQYICCGSSNSNVLLCVWRVFIPGSIHSSTQKFVTRCLHIYSKLISSTLLCRWSSKNRIDDIAVFHYQTKLSQMLWKVLKHLWSTSTTFYVNQLKMIFSHLIHSLIYSVG